MPNCPICNKKINRKSPKAKYCSDSCKYKAYRIKNPDKVKRNQDRYNKNNHEKRLETYRKYRIKKGLSKTIWTKELINTCKECKNEFHPPKNVPYKKYCCSSCRSKFISRKFKQENPEKVKAYMKKYDSSIKGKERRKRRLDAIKAYQKKWRENNPTKSAEYAREYRLKYPKKTKESTEKYKKSLKGRFANRKRSHIYRMLIKKNYDHNRLIPLLQEQKYKCPLCQTKYAQNLDNMELGHIFSMKKFPTLAADIDNIIPICKRCNRRMRTNLLSDFCIKNNYAIPDRVLKYLHKQKRLMNF